jgi:hypothetical protein
MTPYLLFVADGGLQALRRDLPPSLLATADEVIE